MRILWVVPRFGEDVVGGAETLVRELAKRAAPDGWTSEIATTCAIDHETWENVLEPGSSEEAGLLVHRFPVGERSQERYEALRPLILDGRATYLDELEWLANSVWAPELDRFIERSGRDYDLIVYSPYLFGTTVWGAFIHPERSALLPCLHDEGYARLETVRRAFETVKGCLFNSDGEARLAERLYDVRARAVVGMGFDPPNGRPSEEFSAPRGLGQYVLYAGRLEAGKRVDVAVDYAVRYAAEREDAPRLVLSGRGSYKPPPWASGIVVEAGSLSTDERRAARAEALALVVPSVLESLSIVLLETWLDGTPALVARRSDVLRNHCEVSGGGLTFDSYEDYRDALDELRADPEERTRMGAAGRAYVTEVYSWPAVRRRFESAAEMLAA